MPKQNKPSSDLVARLTELGALRPPVKLALQPSILTQLNIPKPLHGVNPRTILGRTWWDKERRAAYESTNYHCLACGVSRYQALFRQWMEGHEIYEIDYLLGTAHYLKTVPLCHACHNFIHSGRMERLLEQGKLELNKYRQILSHGNHVLTEAGLIKPPQYTGPMADWKDWRLFIGKRKYKPKFKNETEYNKFHNSNDAEE